MSSAENGRDHNVGEAVQNPDPGAANTSGAFPLTTAAIGAQFEGHLQQETPTHILEQQRQGRIARFREGFTELGIEISEELLRRLESVDFNMAVPDAFVELYTVLREQGSPWARWETAEHAWNEYIIGLRSDFQESGVLKGWEDLESLPFSR